MNFRDMRNGLEREINSPAYIKHFEKAQERTLELQAFDLPLDIVKIFQRQEKNLLDVKAHLLKIILVEYQSRPHPLWSALLILCFFPWLTNCYKRAIEKTEQDKEETRMLVIESFLESASRMKLDENGICILTLLLNTERKVVTYLRRTKQREEIEISTPNIDYHYDPVSATSPEEYAICSQLHFDDEQMGNASRAEDNEMMHLLFDIVMNNDTVTDYVERKYGEKEDEEKEKQYWRVTKGLWRFRKKTNFDCPKK